jgi:hypothetical protein
MINRCYNADESEVTIRDSRFLYPAIHPAQTGRNHQPPSTSKSYYDDTRQTLNKVSASVATFVRCVPYPFNFQTVGATTRTVDLFEGHRG